MKRSKKAMLAAGLLAGAAAMTGCASMGKPASTPTPAANERATAEPPTAEQTAQDAQGTAQPSDQGAGSSAEEGEAPLPLFVDGHEADAPAYFEDGRTLLPVEETASLLGWEAEAESAQDGALTRHALSLTRQGSRISVTWVVSDNTIRQITWQRDGLLVPVDTLLTTFGDAVYAPAAFFEEAMGARVDRVEGRVEVAPPAGEQAPPEQADGTVGAVRKFQRDITKNG